MSQHKTYFQCYKCSWKSILVYFPLFLDNPYSCVKSPDNFISTPRESITFFILHVQNKYNQASPLCFVIFLTISLNFSLKHHVEKSSEKMPEQK